VTVKQFGLALLCVAIVLLGVAWVAGRQSLVGTGGPAPSLDAVRLGPDPGQSIPGYLAGLPARLPPAGAAPVPALVQFADELTAPDTLGLLAGTVPATVVFRVPAPRVQTALRFEVLQPVDGPNPSATARRQFSLAQQAAQRAAEVESGRLTGRAASVARYEASALAGGPAASQVAGPASPVAGPAPCRCVLAVLVMGDRAALSSVAGRPGVRAVDAAPEGTPVSGVALAPLLPEQKDVAGPVPDDGPVPVPVSPG
jgi:hypothetical protein